MYTINKKFSLRAKLHPITVLLTSYSTRKLQIKFKKTF